MKTSGLSKDHRGVITLSGLDTQAQQAAYQQLDDTGDAAAYSHEATTAVLQAIHCACQVTSHANSHFQPQTPCSGQL